MKKFLVIFCAIVFSLGAFTLVGCGKEPEDDTTITLDNGLVVDKNVIIGFEGDGNTNIDLVIPETYGENNISITEIAPNAFKNVKSINTLTISRNIRKIGLNAFLGAKISKLNILDLESWCLIDFEYSSGTSSAYSNPTTASHNLYLNGELIEDLVIPESITVINEFAFDSIFTIKTITFPTELVKIGMYSISIVGLKSVYFNNTGWYRWDRAGKKTAIPYIGRPHDDSYPIYNEDGSLYTYENIVYMFELFRQYDWARDV